MLTRKSQGNSLGADYERIMGQHAFATAMIQIA
jgi:hypothetical protein